MSEDPPDAPDRRPERGIDDTVPNSARIMNYWLGGKDHYAVDQEAGEQYRVAFPKIVDMAVASRALIGRAVRYLVVEAGVRQFLDIGTGLPTAENTHAIAQRAAPECRIVYVDNDPLVLTHARALLTSTSEGSADYLDADLRDPGTILDGAARTLDFSQPVALILMSILGHLPDQDEALAVVRRLMDAFPSGSHLLIGDGTNLDPTQVSAQQGYNDTGAAPYHLRSPDELAEFFDGLEIVEPGLVPCAQWPDTSAATRETVSRCGLGRKP